MSASASSLRRAIFAGGCFWCLEPPFEKLPGVVAVLAGYTGGPQHNPDYDAVSSGSTGHVEAVEIIYDPQVTTYDELLETFWQNIDPTDAGGQFVDRGKQYRTVIFCLDEEQRRLAEESRQALDESGRFSRPIVTEILPAGVFYPAESRHQDYYRKNPQHYARYRWASGRDHYLAELWKDAEAGRGGCDDCL